MVGLNFVTDSLMQLQRDTFIQVLHIYDDSKDYLPPSYRKDALKVYVDAKLTSSASTQRYRISWVAKDGVPTGERICGAIRDLPANYVCLGFVGRKGKKDAHMLSSNTLEVLCHGRCSVIVFKDETPEELPIKRPTKFVVSVSLNQSSTKAFLDALRLSRPDDEIHVVYIKSYMERTDSDYTKALREKYSGFFGALEDGAQQVFHKFHGRHIGFHMVEKQIRESTAQAVVRYADDVEADFVVVGTNALRVERGKKPIGSVSLQVIMLTDRNFIVANWVNVNPELYGKHYT